MEIAGDEEVIFKKIETNVSLSVAPSNPGQKTFKPKNIIKSKVIKKASKGSQNKENINIITGAKITSNLVNAEEFKVFPRRASTAPKEKENVVDNNTLESRRSSVSKIPRISSKNTKVSKTEMLYKKARAALGKKKEPAQPIDYSKPPLKKNHRKAVIEIVKKQQQIRKNFTDNKGSFNNPNTRNLKTGNQVKEHKSLRSSQENVSKSRLSQRKSGKFSLIKLFS